jgi:aryl-alcohol dehydrogenase-like predicted oxidoreductase
VLSSGECSGQCGQSHFSDWNVTLRDDVRMSSGEPTRSCAGLLACRYDRPCDFDGTRAVVNAAIDAGITLFDTSDSYGPGLSEEFLGQVLTGRRDQVVLATKFGHRNTDLGYGPAAGAKGGRSYIMRAVENSLRRLRTDYIDLYQIHMPDETTPIEETLSALSDLVTQGKVRYIGNSNFAGWQIAEAAAAARALGTAPFVSAQNRWSLLQRGAEAEVVPAAGHFRLGVLPYFPLAKGLLTGKVRRGQAPPAGTRLAAQPGAITEDRPGGGAHRLGGRARGDDPRRGHRRPGRAARVHLRHRRGNVPRPGQGQCAGRELGAGRRRTRRP